MSVVKAASAVVFVLVLAGCSSSPMRVQYRVAPALTAEDIERTAARNSRMIERSKDGDSNSL